MAVVQRWSQAHSTSTVDLLVEALCGGVKNHCDTTFPCWQYENASRRAPHHIREGRVRSQHEIQNHDYLSRRLVVQFCMDTLVSSQIVTMSTTLAYVSALQAHYEFWDRMVALSRRIGFNASPRSTSKHVDIVRVHLMNLSSSTVSAMCVEI